MRLSVVIAAVTLLSVGPGRAAPAAAQNTPLRIIAFGAHPDDNEIRLAGTAAKWAALGHHVKFVSVTNGDIGHWREAGGPLARRRTAEVDGGREDPRHHHAGARHPRRRARADAGEPPDHHAAHPRVEGRHRARPPAERLPSRPPRRRAAGAGRGLHGDGALLLPRHAAAHEQSRCSSPTRTTSRSPTPSSADIVVAIDDVIEKKLAAMEAMASQFYEGGANGGPQLVPTDEAGKAQAEGEVRESFKRRFAGDGERSIAPSCASCMAPSAATRCSAPRRSRSPNTAGGRTPKRSRSCSRSSDARRAGGHPAAPQPSGMRDAFALSQRSNDWSAGFSARATSGERWRRNSSPRMAWCSYMFPMSSAPGKPSAR